jgi:hypothetical protein
MSISSSYSAHHVVTNEDAETESWRQNHYVRCEGNASIKRKKSWWRNHYMYMSVPGFGRLIAVLSSQRPGFNLTPGHVEYVVNEVALGQVFSPSTSVFSWHYHSTNVPHSFIHLSLTPYNVSNWHTQLYRFWVQINCPVMDNPSWIFICLF